MVADLLIKMFFNGIIVLILASVFTTIENVSAGILSHEQVADMLDLGISADQAVYTQYVVQRLTIEENVISALEYFDDEAALPLPATDLEKEGLGWL